MANAPVNLDVVVDNAELSGGAITDIQEGMADAMSGGIQRGFAKSEKVNKTYGKLMEAGFTRAGQKLIEAAKKLDAQEQENLQKLSSLKEQISKEENADAKKRLSDEYAALDKKLQTENKNLETKLSREQEASERRLQLLEEADKRSQKSWLKKAEAAGSVLVGGIEGVGDVLTSGSLDPAQLAKALSEGIGDFGELASGKLAQMGFGEAASALSVSATALAGAAAGVTAVVAVFAAAYGQMKELNEELASTIAPVELAAQANGDLGASLTQLRQGIIDVAMATRMDTKEVITAMNSFHSAGITIEELGRISGDTANTLDTMVGVTEAAILASKGLGIEVSDFAGFLNNIQKLGGSLTDVTGSFGLITEGARRAGMTTKDFFTAVNEASTGMSLYNFRIGDTVGLFTSLTKILGEDLAKEKLGLQKTFAGMSFQDRYTNTLTTGKGTVQKIFKADAERQAEEFTKNFGEKISGGLMLNAIGGPGNIDVEALGNLSEKQFVALLSEISADNSRDADLAAQQLQTLRNVAVGTTGGVSKTTVGYGGVSRLGELALELGKDKTFLGGKSISEAAQNPILRAKLEASGLTGEELESTIRLDRMLRAKFQQKVAKGELSANADFFEELTKGTLTNDEDMKKIAEKNLTTAEKIGYDTLTETRGIGQDIKNVIAGLLESIAGYVEYIASWLGLRSDNPDGRFEKIEQINRNIESLNEQRTDLGSEINELKSKYNTATDTEKELLGAQIQARKEEMKALMGQTKEQKAMMKAYTRGGNDEDAAAAGAQARYKGSGGQSLTGEQLSSAISKDNENLQVTGLKYNAPDWLEQTLREQGFLKGKGGQENINKAYMDYFQGELQSGKMTKAQVESRGGVVSEKAQEPLTMANIQEVGAKDKADITAFLSGMEQTPTQEKQEEDSRIANVDTAGTVQDLLKLQKEEQRENKLKSLMAATGLSQEDASKISSRELESRIKSGSGSLEQKNKALVDYGYASLLPPVEDFIYRGDGIRGTITPIDKKDEFFGAKPGGAIDKATGSGNVIVNISGVGSAEEVARAVASTLKKMGYGNVKKYKQ